MRPQDIIAIVVVSIVAIIYLLIEYEVITVNMLKKKNGGKRKVKYLK